MNEEEKTRLLDIVGEELSAKKYTDLLNFMENIKFEITTDSRIEIQEKAESIGTEMSGTEFEIWLNIHLTRLVNFVYQSNIKK